MQNVDTMTLSRIGMVPSVDLHKQAAVLVQRGRKSTPDLRISDRCNVFERQIANSHIESGWYREVGLPSLISQPML